MEKQLSAIKEQLLSLLVTEYKNIFFTEVIENWPLHSWEQFSNEVKKQGLNLELSGKRDWKALFDLEKGNYATIKREILKLENIKELREYLNLL